MLLRAAIVAVAIAAVRSSHCGTYSCGAGYTQKTPPESITCLCGTDAAPVACAMGVSCNAAMTTNLGLCCTANSCNMGAKTGLDPNVQTDKCSAGTYFTGSTCIYDCNFGYTLTPAAGFTLICDSGGQYDASGGVCVADDCSAVNTNTDQIDGQCFCLPGYTTPAITTAAGAFTHTCTANTCTNPVNGIALLTDYTDCLPAVARVTGDTCNPVCATGYFAVPTTLNLVCQDNGDFDASIIQCNPNTCVSDAGFPGNNLATNTECAGQLTGETCNPNCLPGYYPAKSIYLECDGAGAYTPAADTCVARPCPDHSTAVVNAGVDITCPCDTGYVGTITFGATLQWVGTCDPAPCTGGPAAAPAALNEVDYTSCTLQVTDTTCVPTCKDGFLPTGANNGQFVLSCDSGTNLYVLPAAQLTCTAAACPANSAQLLTTVAPPAAPTCNSCAANFVIQGGGGEVWNSGTGAWTHVCVMSCTGYTCPSGYTVPVPAVTSECASASTASCDPAVCCDATACTGPAVVDPNMDTSTCDVLVSGQTCTPTCNSGYTMLGGPNLLLICPAGVYMSTISCQANACTGGPFMGADPNADYTNCNTLFTQAGPVACATCNPGYTATGSITTFDCRNDLTYDATGFTCTPTACTTPVPVDVGVLSYSSCTTAKVTGDICRPTCNVGYVQGGTTVTLVCDMGNFDASATTCTKADCPPFSEDTVTPGTCLCSAGYTGTPLWTGLAWTSVCQPDSCPAETVANSVSHSVVGSLTGVTGDIVDIQCNPGYTASNGNALCTASGWNPLPGCIANTCPASQVQNSDFSAANSILASTMGNVQPIVCNLGFVCSAVPCQVTCSHIGGLDVYSDLTCNPVECPTNAATYGVCSCNSGYLPFPAVPGVNFDTPTSLWTHECYASCALHTCSAEYDHRATPLVPASIYCAGRDASSCSDALCCVGLIITPRDQRLRTTEAGGVAKFTVQLVGQPTSEVTVTLTSSDTTEGTVSPPQLVFNSLSWNILETVTVRGVNDDIDEPADVDYQIQFTLTGDVDWAGKNPPPLPATNSDDDERGVKVTPLPINVTELVVYESGGSNPEFEVVLTSEPTADVIVPVVSSLATEGRLLTAPMVTPTAAVIDLLFTPMNWNVPQTVTLFGEDDDIDDGDQPFLILTNLVRSDDLVSYNNHNPADIAAECIDDDTAGVNIALVAGSTTRESGTLNTVAFTISLNSEPTATVTIPIRSSDISEGVITQSFVTFSASTWNIVTTLTVTGVNDDIADGDIGYSIETLPATSADPKYNLFDAADLQLTNVDDDTADVLIDPTAGLATSEAGGTATYTVVLNSEPIADVTVQPISRDPFEGTASPASFVFTPLDWSVPRTVTVTGVDDLVDDDDKAYTVATVLLSGDGNYDGFATTDVSVTNTDDDEAGVDVDPRSGLFTSEDGTREYFTVVLKSQPTDDVIYSFASNDPTEGAVALPDSFRFTASNWDVPRTVTVTGIPDFVDDDNVTYSVTSMLVSTLDTNYLAILPADVTLVNIDDDEAKIIVDPNSGLYTSEDLLDVTFSIVLASQPLADVTLNLTTSRIDEGLILSTTPVSTILVVFTELDWDTPKRVTVQGQDDTSQDGDIPYTIFIAAATSTDPKYSGKPAQDVSIINLDNDTPGIDVSPNTSVITTEDPGAAGAAIIAIVLTSKPQVGTQVVFDITSSDTTEGTVTPSLTFTETNWNSRQTITITGVDDDMQDGDVEYYVLINPSISTTDPNYVDFPRAPGYRINVTNIDDDVAGIEIPDVILQTSESGTTAETTIALLTRPLEDVSLRITSDISEGLLSTGVAQAVPSGSITISFTNITWGTPQRIIVTGVDDYIADGAKLYNLTVGPAYSVDTYYNGITHPGITVNNSDDDVPGIELTHTMNLETTEAGATDYFEVTLTSEPTAEVVMWATSKDSRECSVGRGAITFTSLNWNVTQTVLITGVADEIDDDDQIVTIEISSLISADPLYNNLKPADVLCTNLDDDTAEVVVTGIVSTFTTEKGDETEFVIALASQPVADVTVDVESDKPDEGVVSPAQIIFTPVNWGSSVTVTITGVDDVIDDGDVPYKVIVHPSTSTDPKYQMANGQNVDLENKDDDEAGIIVYPTIGLTTTEAGGTAIFTIVLATEPIANVEIGLTTVFGDEVDSITPQKVTFSPLDWNITKNVTVTGADDGGRSDGDKEVVIITQPALSPGDSKYNGMDAADVNITNIDDDSPGFTIVGTNIQTSEIGETASFTIRLNSQPASDVTIGLVVEDDTEGTIPVNELVFNMGNWETPFTVTVTPVDDFIDDGDITYKITTQPAVSMDADYNTANPVDIYVVNVDNDTAAIVVTGVDTLPFNRLVTAEANSQSAEFYIQLASEPVAQVLLTLSSSDGSEGIVEQGSREIRFTASDWNQIQTVTVVGQNDDIDDDDIIYSIKFSAATTTDPNYDGMRTPDIACINLDDDVRGLNVTPTVNLQTAEGWLGRTVEVFVKLNTQPTALVQVDMYSDNEDEGIPIPSTLVFTTSDWNDYQTVTITGVDDDIADGDVQYRIRFNPFISNDVIYADVDAEDLLLVNVDDDIADTIIRPTVGACRTVSGVEKFVQCQFPFIYEGRTFSSCTNYPSFTGEKWCSTRTNASNHHIDGFTGFCEPNCTGGLTTSEAGVDVGTGGVTVGNSNLGNVADPFYQPGGTAEFTVGLTSRPTSDVTIDLWSDDLTEGDIQPKTLTFIPVNWATAQTVTVIANDDDIADGNQLYSIRTSPCRSLDPLYNNLLVPDVTVNNTDDDIPSIAVSPQLELFTDETGTEVYVEVWLKSQPEAGVSITANSTDLTEGTVQPEYLLFTSSNWNVKQTVTIKGVADNINDDDRVYDVVFGGILSTDHSYRFVQPITVAVVNRDVRDECILNGAVCTSAGQECFDPDTSPLITNNWECRCVGSSTGSARARPAVCVYSGECVLNSQICTAAGQICVDPSQTSNDWQCECQLPAVGVPQRNGAASCVLDECLSHGALCTAVGQTCDDPNKLPTSLGDWTCNCAASTVGSAVAQVAECEWVGECKQRFPICTSKNQTCTDPDVNVIGDWQCECVVGSGTATGTAASCQINECTDIPKNFEACKSVDQVCEDPNPSANSLGDWICKCTGAEDKTGIGYAMPADCIVDECVKNYQTCLAVGQVCNDPNTSPSSTGDWTCNCVHPAIGTQLMGQAVCIWQGECALAYTTCTNAMQTCDDPNLNTQGDWQCVCVPPYRTTSRIGAVATCIYDECDANRDVCFAVGQTCVDMNTDPRSLGDWKCVCGEPAKGEAVLGVAECAFEGECVQNFEVCTSAGQTCNDPDPTVTGDWECLCVSPQQGSALGTAAVCEYDECLEFWQTCSVAGQTCYDPNPTPTRRGDWICNCVEPSQGSARAQAATCAHIGECVANHGVCTQAGQACNDPNTQIDNDWECRCVGQSTGVSTGKASVECEIDECVANGAVCTAAQQICIDKNKNVTSLNDWVCQCSGGENAGVRVMGVATCIRDECLSVGVACTSQGQRCIDENTDPASLDDWICVCTGSSTGQATAKAATCTYTGECVQRSKDCIPIGMTCYDPQATVDGDAVCQCVFPYEMSPTGNGQTCQLDECVLYGSVCTSVGQTCRDPDTSTTSLDNWECVCQHTNDKFVGGTATCQYTGECQVRQPICAQIGTACYDPDPNVPDDWQCKCPFPMTGKQSGGSGDLVCILDECNSNSICSDQNQACNDPNTSPLSTGDWTCSCTGGTLVGTAIAQPATCIRDECQTITGVGSSINNPCTQAGQLCIDPNKDSSSLNDWTCNCIDSTGTGSQAPATCTHTGECISNAQTCSAAGQSCIDPNPSSSVTGDWECRCVPPQTGVGLGKVAVCVLDECVSNEAACHAVGQLCFDPNKTPTNLGDWMCRCASPATGSATAGPAVCEEQGECRANAQTCTSKGQACNDPSSQVGDWECFCIGNQVGRVTGRAAVCDEDECIANEHICRAVGQLCSDPFPSPLSKGDWQCNCLNGGSQRAGVATCSLQGECVDNAGICNAQGQSCFDPASQLQGDWRCVCVYPEVGWRQGKPAPCVLDECLKMGYICTDAGQRCVDTNTNPLSLNDWQCVCMGSSSGNATAKPADCLYDGECFNLHTICGSAGQACRDPDILVDNDWECRCVPPFTGGSIAGIATCVLDECVQHGTICQQAGQLCVDPNTSPTSVGDWQCECYESTGTPAVGKLAQCTFQGECAHHSDICTSKGQSCRDPNPNLVGDWQCICVTPQIGSSTGQPATCVYDECNVFAEVCLSVGQRCSDPNAFSNSLDDWTCECTGSEETGTAVGQAAVCIRDECKVDANREVCASVGQICVDKNVDPISTRDWVCQCDGSGTGSSLLSPATCTYTGECKNNGHLTCSTAGQTCYDPNETQDNDWLCRCIAPLTGESTASVASCVLDECIEFGSICTDAGQVCEDTNTNPFSTGDWICKCQEPLAGTATRKAATCSFQGECITNAVTCTSVGQSCVDPDLSRTDDWACICLLPQTGPNATMAQANCQLDECVLYGSVCTSRGQRCVDPDTHPESTDDWRCECVSPGVGTARGIAVAQCLYSEGDCIEKESFCAAAGQACSDPDIDTADTWSCICVPPTVGTGVRSISECHLDECLGANAEICRAAGQICNDPDTSPGSIGDWTCNCQGSSTGTAVRSVATCLWSGECITAHARCAVEGQSCYDPTPELNELNNNDWMCQCIQPLQGEATGMIAECTINECDRVKKLCEDEGQECFDPDQRASSVGDWECRCTTPSTGTQTAGIAKCILDECGFEGSDVGSDGEKDCPQCRVNRETCISQNQLCQDPDTTTRGDWECVCKAPFTGRGVGKPAACTLDECATKGRTCTELGQQCIDPSQATDDWTCNCLGSALTTTGLTSAVAAPAQCRYSSQDQCNANSGTCTAGGQACEGTSSTWKCICIPPQTGEANSGLATCILDECIENKQICQAAGQICTDPDKSPDSTGDWLCRCGAPSSGVQIGRAAKCELDECVSKGVVCQEVGQSCIDPDKSPGSTGDWTCNCVGSASGTAKAMQANCAFTGECAINSQVCTSVGQTCVDNSPAIGDWQCTCVLPATGNPADKKATVCTLDECLIKGSLCTNVGQSCNDPTRDASSLDDWVCSCIGGATQVAGPASCVYTGECLANAKTCNDVGQDCVESVGKWQCECPVPYTGSTEFGATPCTLDECDERLPNAAVCRAAAQLCKDPNQSANSLNDWTCSCAGDSLSIGTAVAKAAICIRDECLESLKSDICTNAGQLCYDPNTADTSLYDFECRCLGSGTGVNSVASPATCKYEGACAEGGRVCASFSQSCFNVRNENATEDYVCRCVPPLVDDGVLSGKQSRCLLDECLENGKVCSAAGQRCIDTNKASTSTGDWECVCPNSAVSSRLAPVVSCTYSGECQKASNRDACTSVGQVCVDLNTKVSGDWQCECVSPYEGSPAPGRAANCILDECKGRSKAYITCSSVGQRCDDPNTSPESQNDWTCTCLGSTSGSAAVATIANCIHHGECALYQTTCTANQQYCQDQTGMADWQCLCPSPAVGVATAKAAVCELDECQTNRHICTDQGQICVDANTGIIGDWECRCVSPQTGLAGITEPASCKSDECVTNGNICIVANQTCFDPNTNKDSTGDWMCQCPTTNENSVASALSNCPNATQVPGSIVPTPVPLSPVRIGMIIERSPSVPVVDNVALQNVMDSGIVTRESGVDLEGSQQGTIRTQLVYVVQPGEGSQLTQGQLAETYRQKVLAANGTTSLAGGTLRDDVWVGDCVVTTGYQCNDATTACHDSDGLPDQTYQCSCAPPDSGMARNRNVQPSTDCISDCSTCQEVTTSVDFTLTGTSTDARQNKDQLIEAMAKAMGVPVSNINPNVTFTDTGNGNVVATVLVSEKSQNGTEAELRQRVLTNAQADTDTASGSLAAVGFPATQVSSSAATPAPQAPQDASSDDDTIGGLEVWQLILIIAGAVILLGILLWFLTCRSKKPEPIPEPKNNKPVVHSTPEDEELLKGDEMQEMGSPTERPPQSLQTPAQSPTAGGEPYQSFPQDHTPVYESPTGSGDGPSYTTSYGRGARRFGSLGPSQLNQQPGSPYSSLGRGTPIPGSLLEGSEAAPGTSGWV
eukprot:TRINITY_DN5030_c1_g4_i1.p1 TRINITY_DN5030_c1_g4~~TRINITY_DN5030_c1_g4_i1.p1  ORF type:complete len:6131 (+),score=1457.99 TRINITY_DN5030_c1_g4_i1:115-18507(+)